MGFNASFFSLSFVEVNGGILADFFASSER